MEPESIAIFIPIITVVGAFIMIIYLRRYENEERMAMIEKGINPKEFTPQKKNTNPPLRAALLLMGVGLGLLIGYFLDSLFRMEEVAYFSMIFLFGGAGLGLSYRIEENKNNKLD